MLVWTLKYWKVIVSFSLVVGSLYYGWHYVRTTEDYTPVEITAAHDVPENGLRVFAQFTVAQSLHFDQSHLVKALKIPIYWPEDSEWLRVDLTRNGRLVGRWRLQPLAESGTEVRQLSIETALLLDGDLEVLFDGQHVAYQDQDRAARIFIETSDQDYSKGHYRIAQNDKEGDIGMSFVAERIRWERFATEWGNNPAIMVDKILKLIYGIILVGCIPFVIADVFSKRTFAASAGNVEGQ